MTTIKAESDVLHPGQKLSLDEFLRRWENMPELKRAELIGGVVSTQAALKADHGGMDNAIGMWLLVFQAHTAGTYGAGDTTTFLGENAPQPDQQLFLLPEAGGRIRFEKGYVSGAPELVAEVCGSSRDYDLGVKKDLYESAGVDEYITVLLDERANRWHRLEEGAYKLVPPDADGVWRSSMFPGLWLDGAALLSGDLPQVLAVLQDGLDSPEHGEFVERLKGRMEEEKG